MATSKPTSFQISVGRGQDGEVWYRHEIYRPLGRNKVKTKLAEKNVNSFWHITPTGCLSEDNINKSLYLSIGKLRSPNIAKKMLEENSCTNGCLNFQNVSKLIKNTRSVHRKVYD